MNTTYHVCKYTPTELLAAFGGQCALLDEAPETFDLSDQVAHPNLCGFGKSVIQAVMAGHVKELVLVNCCDTIRSAYDILKEFGNLDFLYLLDILHSQESCAVEHARDQLLALAEAYGKYKGTQFDRAAFFAAYALEPFDQVRREFCRLPPLPVRAAGRLLSPEVKAAIRKKLK